VEAAFSDKNPATKQELKLGVDVGGGGDYNVYVHRDRNVAWVESKTLNDN
jgi:hypothetical protein